jgi:hypothetical protein
MPGEGTERLERRRSRNAVDDEPFTSLKVSDGSPGLGPENPVDRPVMGSAEPECDLERRDVRRSGQRGRRQEERDERARACDQPASHSRSRKPLVSGGGRLTNRPPE